jgi:hypothetical protein
MQENQKNESLFLVSSAIHTKHGVYSPEQRLEQTIETCKSIKSRCPADIMIIDGGDKDLSDEEKEKLSPHIFTFISFCESPHLKYILSIPSQDIVKNMAEIMTFGTMFEQMNMTEDYKHYKRIFKMSGRYVLNDDFNYDTHYNAKGKIVIRGPFTSQFTPAVTGNVIFQYMSRLWSFDSELFPEITQVYRNMFADMNKRLTDGGYIDIEHLLFSHLREDLIQKISKIGVQGNIAPNGNGVSD